LAFRLDRKYTSFEVAQKKREFPLFDSEVPFVIAHDESSGPKVENVTIAINAAQPKTIFK